MGFWHRHPDRALKGWKVTRIAGPDGGQTPQLAVIYMTEEQEAALTLDPTGMFYIELDPNQVPPLVITQDLPGVSAGDAGATYVPVGTTFSATVETEGGIPPLSYQWFKFSGGVGTAITTAQNPTAQSKEFQITNYQAASQPGSGNGDWYVEVTDSTGQKVTSQRVRTKLAISLSTNLPATDTWTVGTADSLAVVVNAVSGLAPYTYQWQKLNGSTWENLTNGGASGYSGVTSATLNIATPQASSAGSYRCIATSSNTNPPNNVTSLVCVVTVNPAA